MTHIPGGPGDGEHTAPDAGSFGDSGRGSGVSGPPVDGKVVTSVPAGDVDGPSAGGEVEDAPAGGAVTDRPPAPAPVRLRLDLGYDGTAFSGWAAQPGRRTVAGELSAALEVLFRRPVPLAVAGRTDAGVHASGQVAHIDVDPVVLAGLARRTGAGPGTDADPLARGAFGLLRRLAGLLDPDVRVRAVGVAPEGFDARFAALRRHYRYRIAATEFGVNPLRRWDTLAWSRPLSVAPMQAAARELLGLHDFAAYCKPVAHEGATTIRELQALTVRELDDEPGVVAVDVSADAFCHSMVRSLVGALLAVGDGRTPVGRPRELLVAQVRSSAIQAAPARGLTLVRVDYPAADALRARTALTRAVRQTSESSVASGAAGEPTR